MIVATEEPDEHRLRFLLTGLSKEALTEVSDLVKRSFEFADRERCRYFTMIRGVKHYHNCLVLSNGVFANSYAAGYFFDACGSGVFSLILPCADAPKRLWYKSRYSSNSREQPSARISISTPKASTVKGMSTMPFLR